MIVDDLSRQLFIATCTFVYQLRARDRAIKSAEVAFFCEYLLTTSCLQNRHGEHQEYHPKFLLLLLRSANVAGTI